MTIKATTWPETSIKDALKKLRQQKNISLDIKLDKATRNLAGSPDITESIFTKIGSCNKKKL